ncbi:hypothetical protein SAMN05421736_1387 [Evansella caseinilytica]|uniref:Uncharacterized protein n=1 Tax=Evansella caseinilytica TaxID=1503961 RepID=A0A1H3V2A0_9BACI|nr:hypothetical protein [Evansella caseinilytica]SDZ68718.1 hypothetical protein SAMN05421736_1387 [Evansella caseinilytica]
MIDWKKRLLPIIAIIVAVLLLLFYDYKALQKSEEQASLFDIQKVIELFQLDAIYYSVDSPFDMELSRSESTDAILARWKAVSEVFPQVSYPKEAIDQEDWFQMEESFKSNQDVFEDVIKKMYEEAESVPSGERPYWLALTEYILYNYQGGRYRAEVLGEFGIE